MLLTKLTLVGILISVADGLIKERAIMHIDEKTLLEALLGSYNLGAQCFKEVNSTKGWTPAKSKRERAALDRILKSCGAAKMTDDEYANFNK